MIDFCRSHSIRTQRNDTEREMIDATIITSIKGISRSPNRKMDVVYIGVSTAKKINNLLSR